MMDVRLRAATAAEKEDWVREISKLLSDKPMETLPTEAADGANVSNRDYFHAELDELAKSFTPLSEERLQQLDKAFGTQCLAANKEFIRKMDLLLGK